MTERVFAARRRHAAGLMTARSDRRVAHWCFVAGDLMDRIATCCREQGAMANTGCHGQAQRGHAPSTRAAHFSLRDRCAWAWHTIGLLSYPSIQT